MKYLGTNFTAKIKAWINANFTTKTAFEQHAVWTKGAGEKSIITVACKNSIGDDTTKGAIGENSVAMGFKVTASGSPSYAEGHCTKASGNCSHAVGYVTEASAYCSHAEGASTKASGRYSHAEGYHTKASGHCSHAEGAYNVETPNSVHSVGIGTAEQRKNAEYIYMLDSGTDYWGDDPKNGYKYLIGVGGYDGVSTDTTQYKSVQEVFADLTERIEQLGSPLPVKKVQYIVGKAFNPNAYTCYDKENHYVYNKDNNLLPINMRQIIKLHFPGICDSTNEEVLKFLTQVSVTIHWESYGENIATNYGGFQQMHSDGVAIAGPDISDRPIEHTALQGSEIKPHDIIGNPVWFFGIPENLLNNKSPLAFISYQKWDCLDMSISLHIKVIEAPYTFIPTSCKFTYVNGRREFRPSINLKRYILSLCKWVDSSKKNFDGKELFEDVTSQVIIQRLKTINKIRWHENDYRDDSLYGQFTKRFVNVSSSIGFGRKFQGQQRIQCGRYRIALIPKGRVINIDKTDWCEFNIQINGKGILHIK